MADEHFGNGYPARIARLEERARAVEDRLKTMPTEAQVAVLTANQGAMNLELARQGKAFDQFLEDWTEDKNEERRQRSSRNTAVWGWIVALICCVIGSATLVIVSVSHL